MQILRRFLIVKISVIVLVAVLCGFAGSSWLTTQRQLETMTRLHEQGAQAIAESLATGVRNSMLRGDGLAVSEFLQEATHRLALADIHVYDPNGEEVFGKRPPPPDMNDLPEHVRNVITTLRDSSHDDVNAYPIPNEQRCQSCHEEGKLRGVLSLSSASSTIHIDGSEPSLAALSTIARSAFVQIMTGRKDEDLDDYFEALVTSTPGLEGVTVVDNEGDAYFTGGSVSLDPETTTTALTQETPFTRVNDTRSTHIIPLPMEPRCQGCHEEDEAIRGAMALSFDVGKLDASETLRHAVTTSLQHVMLAGLGRLVVGFVDDVGRTGLTSALTVHEANGRLYHDAFRTPTPPALVAQTLESKSPQVAIDEANNSFHFITPMHNEPRCQSCHGTDQALRGAISVTLDTHAETVEVEARKQESLLVSSVTVLVVLMLLFIGLRWTVLRPVKLIGEVADAVADGQLDASVDLNRRDEMGRLADQINEMTRGLRQRLELAKFVSDETFRTVETIEGIQRVGRRRRVTMLFSDIRGFTAFSETREPEEVVEMLNAYLQVQAEVVLAHGGDIDKFVGDELMARFDGVDQELRAVQAAVAITEVVNRLSEARGHETSNIAVGVGVNTGDVIVGAMGAETRMDYTVIGDAVNLAARLCSAAGRSEVILSDTTRDGAGDVASVRFEAMDPIPLKGKSELTPISKATRRA
ncbi:MAG: adenylate/guanylate cyclase domain-containing protein [Myxococcota bacterium]